MKGLPLEAVMTTSLVTAKPSTSVREALHLLEDMDIRHLPIVEDGKLVGIISDRDLREYRLPFFDQSGNRRDGSDILDTPVSEVMGEDVISVDTGEDAAAAIEVILKYGVGAVTVVDRDTDELVGIVSYVDLLRAALRGE